MIADGTQTQLCEALIPLFEPPDSSITLQEVRSDQDNPDRITISYRVAGRTSSKQSATPDEHQIVCQYAGSGFDRDRLVLQTVETPSGRLSETQLVFLNKKWIADDQARIGVTDQIAREGLARDKGWITLDFASGYFLQQIVNAGPTTSLYALRALAYSLVYGLTNRINLAFGGLATVGAFGALIGILGAVAIGVPQLSLAIPLALLCALVLAGGTGAAIGNTVFLPLIGRSSQPLLVATIGLALVIQEFLARAQGVQERWLSPILATQHRIADGPFDVIVTSMQLAVTMATAILIVIVFLTVTYSRFGRVWRAVSDDRLMASMLGVNVNRVIVASFALASGLAGIGGSILTLHYGGTSFTLGTTIGLKALVAAIIGGIGSLSGAVIGGLLLGLTEAFWSAYEPIVWREGVIYIALVAWLILKPEGIFGTRRALEERGERP